MFKQFFMCKTLLIEKSYNSFEHLYAKIITLIYVLSHPFFCRLLFRSFICDESILVIYSYHIDVKVECRFLIRSMMEDIFIDLSNYRIFRSNCNSKCR